jgi:hypothetical protein
MMTIHHQLLDKPFFIPNWKVRHLFIGTFNPQGGEEVRYFYGRPKNQTWKLLSEIFSITFDPNSDDFFELIQKHHIACMDMIRTVVAPKADVINILGRGYNDSKIINNRVLRVYNTSQIRSVIINYPGIKVYSTWGKGQPLNEWTEEVSKIPNRIQLVSPSMVARVPAGVEKFDYILRDWKSKINI